MDKITDFTTKKVEKEAEEMTVKEYLEIHPMAVEEIMDKVTKKLIENGAIKEGAEEMTVKEYLESHPMAVKEID